MKNGQEKMGRWGGRGNQSLDERKKTTTKAQRHAFVWLDVGAASD